MLFSCSLLAGKSFIVVYNYTNTLAKVTDGRFFTRVTYFKPHEAHTIYSGADNTLWNVHFYVAGKQLKKCEPASEFTGQSLVSFYNKSDGSVNCE